MLQVRGSSSAITQEEYGGATPESGGPIEIPCGSLDAGRLTPQVSHEAAVPSLYSDGLKAHCRVHVLGRIAGIANDNTGAGALLAAVGDAPLHHRCRDAS